VGSGFAWGVFCGGFGQGEAVNPAAHPSPSRARAQGGLPKWKSCGGFSHCGNILGGLLVFFKICYNPRMGYWRQHAKTLIYEGYREAIASGQRGRAIRRWVNKYYFPKYGAPRAKYPYRVWVEELNALMARELAGVRQMVLPIPHQETSAAAFAMVR